MSRLAGYWLLSSAAGTAGLMILGGYTRLLRAKNSLTEWKPSSWIYPDKSEEWDEEFKKYEGSPAYKSALEPLNIEAFKEIYTVDWWHRTYALGLGAYMTVPMLLFWKRLLPKTKAFLLPVAGIGGLMGAVGFLTVYHGKVAPSLPPPESSPLHRTIHQTLGAAFYGLLLWGGLTQLRPDNTSRIQTLARLKTTSPQRLRYLLALPFLAGTIATGGLVANNGAGKILTNWPWYGNSWWFPENALQLQPLPLNFLENKDMIQFCHRTLSYLTALSVYGVWRASRGAPVGALAAQLSLAAVSLQLISGVLTLTMNSPFDKSLGHESISLVVLTTLLVGLHGVRKPINIKSLT